VADAMLGVGNQTANKTEVPCEGLIFWQGDSSSKQISKYKNKQIS
jgi:hypothetical protein